MISALLDGRSSREAVCRGNLIGSLAVQVLGDMEGLPNRKHLATLEAKLSALQIRSLTHEEAHPGLWPPER